MTFSVKIEHGNHVTFAPMHALPRAGDRISCAFPTSGIPKLWLQVARVYFHQTVEFEGSECPEPFQVVVTTEDDPDMVRHNAEIFERLMRRNADG